MAKPPAETISLRGESWRALLCTRPRRNAAATTEYQPDGSLRLIIPLLKPRWFVPPISWFLTPRWQRTVEINGLGLRVWEWCDGYRRIEDIIDLLAEQYALTFHEARAAILSYLKVLVEKGILAIEQE